MPSYSRIQTQKLRTACRPGVFAGVLQIQEVPGTRTSAPGDPNCPLSVGPLRRIDAVPASRADALSLLPGIQRLQMGFDLFTFRLQERRQGQ